MSEILEGFGSSKFIRELEKNFQKIALELDIDLTEVNEEEYINPYTFDYNSDLRHWYHVDQFDAMFKEYIEYLEAEHGEGVYLDVDTHEFHINQQEGYMYSDAVERKMLTFYDSYDSIIEELPFWGALGRIGAEATYEHFCGVRGKIGIVPQTQAFMSLDGAETFGIAAAAQPVIAIRSMNYIYDEENNDLIEFPAIGAQFVCFDPYASLWMPMIGHSGPDFVYLPEDFFKIEGIVPFRPSYCEIAGKFVVSSSSFDDTIYHQKAEKDEEFDYPYSKVSDGKVIIDADTSEARSLSVDFDRSNMEITIKLAVKDEEGTLVLDDDENVVGNRNSGVMGEVNSEVLENNYEFMEMGIEDYYYIEEATSETIIGAEDAGEYSFTSPVLGDPEPVELMLLLMNGEYDDITGKMVDTYEDYKAGETSEPKFTALIGVLNPNRSTSLGATYDDDIDVVSNALSDEAFIADYFLTDDNGDPVMGREALELKDVGNYGWDFTTRGYKVGTEDQITYADHVTGAVPASYGVGAGKINRVEIGINYFYKVSYGWDYAPLEFDHNVY